MRKKFLPFHMPSVDDEEIKAVEEVLRSGWLTTGPKVKQFEDELAKYIGASNAVAVSSGTAALHVSLEAVGITEGDEVIVPTMTFASTAEVVVYLKARPVLVDCQRATLNIDPVQIEKAITDRTKAIIPVHFGGHPCDMEEILEIGRNHNLTVVEDAAHALPARYRGEMVGTIGDITCFSFYATKTITTGEGGMATTEHLEWPERMRIVSQHGISKDAWERYTAEGSWYYEILCPGYKYNMTDITAAIGIEQVKKCDGFCESRRRIVALYHEGFSDLPEVETPTCKPDVEHAWHLYVLRLNVERITISRNQFIEELRARNIGTSVHFVPLHLHPYYRDTYGYKPDDFSVAYQEYQRIISLPLYPRMTDEDARSVIEAVRDVVTTFRR